MASHSLSTTTVANHRPEFGVIDLAVTVAEPAEPAGLPLILCIHGWPETWYSWRHQIEHFAAKGRRIAAMDVRGYGGSSRPAAVEAYRLTELCSDVVAVLDALSPDQPAVLFGHDWGAPIAWNSARLHPSRVAAVAGLSVPYTPASGDSMELWEALYAGRFFYMKYFQEIGVAEASFERDVASSMRKVYYGASADAPESLWFDLTDEDADFFDELIDPDPVPAWMAGDTLTPIIEANAAGPSHGFFHRYRAQRLDGAEIEPLGDPTLTQPTCFIGGEADVVRRFVPGLDLFADPGAACGDHRDTTIIAGAGHWVHQEKPAETNAALQAFIDAL